MSQQVQKKIDAIQARQKREAYTAVLIIFLGIICVVFGVTALFGVYWGFIVFGVIAIALGVLIGLNN